MKKLSKPQVKVLKRSPGVFKGHSFKTIESLSKRGLVTYQAELECRSCGAIDCSQHRGKRWKISTMMTEEGWQRLKEWRTNQEG